VVSIRYAATQTGLNAKLISVSAGQSLVVGATGFEPVTSSVSVNAGLPLCYPPFSQLTFDRRWQS
jgi:hypothetical protein